MSFPSCNGGANQGCGNFVKSSSSEFSNTSNSTGAFEVNSGKFGINTGGFGVNYLSTSSASNSLFAPANTRNPFSLGGNAVATSPSSSIPSWQSPLGVQSKSPFETTSTVPTDQPPFRSYPTPLFVEPTSSITTTPFGTLFSSPGNSASIFGQTSSSLSFNPSPFGKPFSSSGNSTSVFGRTGSSSISSFDAPSPFSKPFSSSGNSTSAFGQTGNSSISSFFNAPSSFNKPFSSSGNSTFVFGQTSSSSSSVFGRNSTGTALSDSTFPLFSSTQSSQKSPAVNYFADFHSFITSSTASQVQNTFSPVTSSEPGRSGSQGTKAIPYAQTPEEGNITGILLSHDISGMPYYKLKSHEEFRLEDYQGKTVAIFQTETRTTPLQISGTDNSERICSISALPINEDKSHEELRLEYHQSKGATGSKSSSSFSVFNASPSSSIQTSIPSTGAGPGFSFVNPPNSGPSVLNTNASTAVNSFLSHSQPKMPAPLSTGLHWGNPFSIMQPITSIPDTGTNRVFSTVPASESAITSIPEKISAGGFISGADSSRVIVNELISQCPVSVRQSLVTNPFATEPKDELPTMTIHYGISCLPVSDYAEPAKSMPLMNIKRLSLGPHRRPIEKYRPKADEEKVPFYFQEIPGIYGSGSVLIPRENPRAWIVHPNEKLSLEINLSKLSVSEQSSKSEAGGTHDGSSEVQGKASCAAKMNISMNNKHDVEYLDKKNMNPIIIHTGNDCEKSCITAHHADTTVMPKLSSPEYYVEPAMEDLAANERPGFCGQVKDFVVGRHGYGSIKFLGETDVRNLNLESIVQFNMREVIVYADEKLKPPVGQELNKPAEITLLNVTCVDKNTGKQYTDGPRVDNYRRLLMKKALEKGAEFISFDPTKGEWRFKVEHF